MINYLSKVYYPIQQMLYAQQTILDVLQALLYWILLFIFYLFKSNTISYSFTFSPAFRCNLTLRAKRSNPKLFAHNVRISTAIGARNTFRFFFSLVQIYYVQEFFFNIAFPDSRDKLYGTPQIFVQ